MLNKKVEVTVPTTIRDIPAPADLINLQIENTLSAPAAAAGGATAVEGEGAWLDAQGKLVRERVYNVYAYCTDADLGLLTETAMRVAMGIKEAMDQECVAVVIDNVMHFA